MNLTSSGLIVISVLIARSAGQTEAGSGEEEEEAGSGSGEELEVVTEVINSADYSMATSDGSLEMRLSLENRRVDGAAQLHLICEVSTTKASLFSDSSCVPEVYLVAGHSVCSGLPEVVSAKKLVEIRADGQDEVQIDASWEELPGKCVLVLQKSSCEGDGSGSGDGETIIDVGDGEGEGTTTGSLLVRDLAEAEGYLNTPQFSSVLRRPGPGLGRTYNTISLSGFSLLSSGSTSAFTVAVPVVTYGSTGGFPVNVVSTTYNKWATLPYLQLSGINYQDTLALGGIILFLLLAFQLRSVSFTPVKRRVLEILDYADSGEFADRIDQFQSGIFDAISTTTGNVAHPWVDIFHTLERKYFDRVNNRHHQETISDRRTEELDQGTYHRYQTNYENHQEDNTFSQASQLFENLNNYFPSFDSFNF